MELSRNVLKFIAGVSLTVAGFIVSNNLYFRDKPLFGVPFFGQTILAFAFGAFGVLVLPVLVTTVVGWFETLITKTAIRAVSDFWEQQTRKMQEAKRKKEEDREKSLSESSPVILDTSAIIDGRILDVVKTGFLDNDLVIPREVIEELQLISDNSDQLKRQRGRRGLDMIKELKKVSDVTIREREGNEGGGEDVDKVLIRLSKKLNGSIATVDFNLNKVALVSGIKVLNVNDLSNAVKTVALPGEPLKLKIVQVGKEPTQGVGYLDDGTMVVVEFGSDLVGKEAEVIISRTIQTPAGKMFFAKKQ